MTPPAQSEPVLELTLHRDAAVCKAAGVRPHEAHPVHEAAMRSPLPTTLQVLRIDGCRIRTWPAHLPAGIMEFYAAACDFFTLPDLSMYQNLIVIEMPDNRLETLNRPLPPTLARLNVQGCALREVQTAPPASLTSVTFADNPGLMEVLTNEQRAYQRAVAAARAANQAPPVQPPSAVPQWVRATAAPMLRVVAPVHGAQGPNTPAANVNPYTNDHSVHDSGIQDSTRANLKYIATYKPDVPPYPDVAAAIAKELNKDTPWLLRVWPFSYKSLAFTVANEIMDRNSQPYVMHGYMPAEIVDRLWLRIMDFEGETRKEVMKRFVDEILDAKGHCTNGFMVRLANVLIGYDENVVMKMRPAQILQARIPATLERLRKVMGIVEGGSEGVEFWVKALRQTWEDMEEVDMSAKERGSWLSGLTDGLVEPLTEGIEKRDRGTTVLDEEGHSVRTIDKKIKDALETHKLYMAAKQVEGNEQPGLDHYIKADLMSFLEDKWKGT